MGDPLPQLERPKWLKDLIATFPDRPDLHAKWIAQNESHLEQQRIVKREQDRVIRLEQLSKATASTRAGIVAKALDERRSEKWRLGTGRIFEGPEGGDAYMPGDNKCNLFVYEMLTRAGVPLPLITYENRLGEDRLRPYLAGEWANPRVNIAGFEILKVPPDVPQAGDIAAIAHVSWDATGHVGIVANSPQGTPNWTVSGRHDGVVHNEWGFRDEQKGEVVFRRYVGPAK